MLKPILTAAFLSVGAMTMAPQAALSQAASASMMKPEFVRMAASGDMFEIESSKLALSKSDDPAIKKFAQMIVTDHMAASKKLISIASEKPSATLDKKHADMMDKLKAASGREFTQLYVTMQLTAHKEAIDLYERYSKTGDDAKLKAFAMATLPTLRAHLQAVEKMQKSG